MAKDQEHISFGTNNVFGAYVVFDPLGYSPGN